VLGALPHEGVDQGLRNFGFQPLHNSRIAGRAEETSPQPVSLQGNAPEMLRNDDLESCLLKFVEPARSQFFEGIKASRHLASKSVCQELSRSAQQSIPTVPCTGRGYVASLSE